MRRRGNLVQRFLHQVYNFQDFRPRQALVATLILLRGGDTSPHLIKKDMAEWITTNGEPTKKSLSRWAADLDIESGIAEIMLKHNSSFFHLLSLEE